MKQCQKLCSATLNCTSIRRCMIETSSGLPRKSSAIFGNLRKFLENVRERSSRLRNNVLKSFGNLRKVVGNLRKIIKNAAISMSI